MAIDKTILAADLAAIIADDPTTVTIGGTQYACRRSQIKRDKKYATFGLESGYEFTLHLVATLVSVSPDDTITYGGTTYRVLDIELGESGIGLALHLGRQYA